MSVITPLRVLGVALVCLSRLADAYPELSTITSLAEIREESEHPLDLFHPERLTRSLAVDDADRLLSVNATEFSGTGEDWITVSWNRINHPKDDDFIALYAVDEEDWLSRSPLKSIYAVESADYLKTGAGSFEVRMLNHRSNVQFVFIRDFFGGPRIIGDSPILEIRNRGYPLYVHLALTANHGEMLVQWASASARISVVQWGTVSGEWTMESIATRTTYTPKDLCGPPASTKGYIDPGYLYAAVIDDIVPGQMYYYRFGNERAGFSEEHSFRGPPLVGPDTSVKLLAVADMGQYNIDYFDNPHGRAPSLGTSRNLNKEEDVDLLMHIGDISYAMGYAADWDVFFDQLNPLVSRVPYMTLGGNHEYDYPGSGDRYGTARDSGGECGVVMERRLQMPMSGPDVHWYSFDFGPMHIVMFSAEHDFEEGTAQYKFLKTDLESVDRSVTPWLVVAVHRPMYPGITTDGPPNGYWYVAQELQATFGELFYENGVDLIWSGHHHSYQRTCPVLLERCVEGAPVQLIFGNAGGRLYTNLRSRRFIEFQASEFGYVRMMVNGTVFDVEAVRNDDGSVMDSVTLRKD